MEKQWTGERVMGGRDSLMRVGSKGLIKQMSPVAQHAAEINAGYDKKCQNVVVDLSLQEAAGRDGDWADWQHLWASCLIILSHS